MLVAPLGGPAALMHEQAQKDLEAEEKAFQQRLETVRAYNYQSSLLGDIFLTQSSLVSDTFLTTLEGAKKYKIDSGLNMSIRNSVRTMTHLLKQYEDTRNSSQVLNSFLLEISHSFARTPKKPGPCYMLCKTVAFIFSQSPHHLTLEQLSDLGNLWIAAKDELFDSDEEIYVLEEDLSNEQFLKEINPAFFTSPPQSISPKRLVRIEKYIREFAVRM